MKVEGAQEKETLVVLGMEFLHMKNYLCFLYALFTEEDLLKALEMDIIAAVGTGVD